MIWRKNFLKKDWVPQLQSHRGYWVKGLQQNTLDSIKKAFELGYEMAEFDVRLTKDDKVILFHDDIYNGKLINDFEFEKIQEIVSADYSVINKLDDVLAWLNQINSSLENARKFKLNIEIKSKQISDHRLEEKVVQLINKYQLNDWVLISSFNPFSLYRIKKLNPTLIRALILTMDKDSNGPFHWLITSRFLNFLCQPDLLHLRFQDFYKNPKIFQNLKVPIVLWTINNEEMKVFNSLEISKLNYVIGVISDEITPESLALFRSF